MTDDRDGSPAGPAPDPLAHRQRRARRPAGARAVLRRAGRDRRVAGIAGGIAAFTGAPSGRVRALFVLSIPLSLGITVPGYLLLWLLLPGPARPEGTAI